MGLEPKTGTWDEAAGAYRMAFAIGAAEVDAVPVIATDGGARMLSGSGLAVARE